MPINSVNLTNALADMQQRIAANPVKAVRSQEFIQVLHAWAEGELRSRARKVVTSGKTYPVTVKREATIFGAHKPKNADLTVVEANNGPLIYVGVRSQMSSVQKNLLTYYQDIIGELSGIHKRFPVTVAGYIYLHPVAPIKPGKTTEKVPHGQAQRLFSAITGRSGQTYAEVEDVYDHFAYLVVDFVQTPPVVSAAWPDANHAMLRIDDFFDNLVDTFNQRNPSYLLRP